MVVSTVGSMRLSIEERQHFLAEPHVAALSVAAGPDRGPLTVPIWYHYLPGGPVWVLTLPDSRKAKLIARAGRFALLVQRTTPTIRYVSIEGPVTETRPSTQDEVRQMAYRYLPADRVGSYVEFAEDEYVIKMTPERWLTSDLGS